MSQYVKQVGRKIEPQTIVLDASFLVHVLKISVSVSGICRKINK